MLLISMTASMITNRLYIVLPYFIFPSSLHSLRFHVFEWLLYFLIDKSLLAALYSMPLVNTYQPSTYGLTYSLIDLSRSTRAERTVVMYCPFTNKNPLQWLLVIYHYSSFHSTYQLTKVVGFHINNNMVDCHYLYLNTLRVHYVL